MTIGSSKRILQSVFWASWRIATASVELIFRGLSFLAENAQTKPANDELNSAVRGGVLNYRTGNLDDSTDPVGWYERD